jgi:hypothetical protein
MTFAPVRCLLTCELEETAKLKFLQFIGLLPEGFKHEQTFWSVQGRQRPAGANKQGNAIPTKPALFSTLTGPA